MSLRYRMALLKNNLVGFCKGIYEYSRLSNKNKHILMSTGIGDIVWFCAYYPSFLEFYSVPELQLITLKKFEGLLQLLGVPTENIIGVDGKTISKLTHFAKGKRYKKLISGQIDDDDLNINQRTGQLVKEKSSTYKQLSKVQIERLGLEMDVLYKYGYFNLPQAITPRRIQFFNEQQELAKKVIENAGILDGDVLLIPYANTRANLPTAFWEEVAKRLIKKNIRVLTNCKDNQETPIMGTGRLVLPLEYIPYVANKVKATISARCGLADLVYYSGGNLLVLHNIVGDDYDDYQFLAASLESFEKIHDRCKISSTQRVKDIRISVEEDYEKQIEAIVQTIEKETN